MRTLAVIPARLGATRLPRKPLRLLGGAPLIVRVWERIRDLDVADHVVVATDDEEIAAVLRARGADVAMTRSNHPSGTDRVAEAVQQPRYLDFELIVNVQGDEPFLPAGAVKGPVALVASRRFRLATSAAPASADILGRPDVVKVVCGDDGRALYFSRAPVPFLRDEADRHRRDALVRQHLGVYAFQRDALLSWVKLPVSDLERVERLEQLRPLAAGIAMGVHVLDAPAPAGVDTEEDLLRANALWDDFYAGRR
jgi:3-deoxy-manno-octulosonate cytidylyltransferase (CMP-KDO synthetase)